jgi:hypothetical protein
MGQQDLRREADYLSLSSLVEAIDSLVPEASAWSSQQASQPGIIELNVGGSIIPVARSSLEARGSPTLIGLTLREGRKKEEACIDKEGRPFLDADPGVFQGEWQLLLPTTVFFMGLNSRL